MIKLTRNAKIFIFTILLFCMLILGIKLLPQEEVKQEVSDSYMIQVVEENVALKSVYLEPVNTVDTEYKEQVISIQKGEELLDYKIDQTYTFKKYLKLVGPQKDAKINNKDVTHNAYSLLLTGDIIEKINTKTNEKSYVIDNARITYNKIPFVLVSEDDSIYIMNKEKTKTKFVTYNDFKTALQSTTKRKTMISW